MFYLIIFIFLLLDQLIKMIVAGNMLPGDSIPVINDIFHFTYVRNTGAGFGILAGKRYLLIVISSLILIGIFIYRYHQRDSRLLKFSLGLITAGALGNLLDRIRLSYVIDYLDFRVWPVFNLADVLVCIGTGLFIIYIWRSEGGKNETDTPHQ